MDSSSMGGRRSLNQQQQTKKQHQQKQQQQQQFLYQQQQEENLIGYPNHGYNNCLSTPTSPQTPLSSTSTTTSSSSSSFINHFPTPPIDQQQQHNNLLLQHHQQQLQQQQLQQQQQHHHIITDSHNNKNKNQFLRKYQRYPDDTDCIEFCQDDVGEVDVHDELQTNKTFKSGGGGGGRRTSGGKDQNHMTDSSQLNWSRNNITATMERYEPSSSSTSSPPLQHHHHQQDYSYAYYEPGAAMRHSNIPIPGTSQHSNTIAGPSRPPPPNSIRALLSKGSRNNILPVSAHARHTYTTRYGTQENIYEEIGEDGRMRLMTAGHSTVSLNHSMVEEEFRRVQSRHRRVLGELNLSVEAMLMPSTPPSDSPEEEDDDDNNKCGNNKKKDNNKMLNSVGPTDELLSPVGIITGGSGSGSVSGSGNHHCGDLDSGFSGSSSGASYIGTLRYNRTNSKMSSGYPGTVTTTTATRSSTPSGCVSVGNGSSSGGTSSLYCSSLRSSQRSQDNDHHQHQQQQPQQRSFTQIIKNGFRSAEDPGPIILSDLNKQIKTSFWRKGWRKIPGFSSTTSVNKAGTIDEPKVNAGSWEDPLPLTQTSPTTASLNNNTSSAQRRSDPLNSFGGSIKQQQQQQNNTINIGNYLNNQNNHQQQQQQQQHHQSSRRRLEHTPSARTVSSEESWCSEGGSERELTTDDDDEEEEDESDRSITSSTTTTTGTRNSQLRSTFNKAKHHLSFDKWRTNNRNSTGEGNVQQQQQQQMPSQQEQQTQQHQHVTNTPGESPAGRLSRWFSIRRGSAHQYDVGGREGGGGGNRNSLENNDEQLQQQIQQQQQQQQQQSQRVPTGSKMPQLPETEEDQHNTFGHGLIGTQNNTTTTTNNTTTSLLNNSRNGGRHHHQITPTLPPAPAGLSQQQLKRRHIVAAIVHSENSYVATLQRLVNDYKRPLEDSQPPILSSTKILTLFHRLPEILQCHTVFRLELADCVRNWDRDEKIGDVFIGSFSKPILLDIYSGFINNFSLAMELAKMEAKRKSALSDFFKVKQISAHDRLSFFGLMVKPVQRFPQFILFLQDLLKYTPQGHHDRMSLQLALTQLESLAEMLNERKREAEQYQAFKEMLGHISGTFNTRSLSSTTSDGSRHRYLLREDNVTQMEFNQSGLIVKSKQRRLLLLNDKVICVSVAPKQSHDFGATEKLSFKWMYPVTDVEIVDNSTSATLSRILTAGLNRGGSLKSNSSGGGRDVISGSGGSGSGANDSATQLTNGADNLCSEMSNLMHDYEVMSRINDLVGTLKGYYKEMNVDVTKRLLTTIQSSIQKKDEEMAWVDSCCLQLITKNKSGKEETYTFQTENPNVKKEWITELRLAQLALDTNNSPAWEFPEHEQRRPLTKMPLFVKAQSVYKSQHQTEVRCGCYYGVSNTRASQRRYKNQNYVWICTSDGLSSHIAILSQHHQQAGVLKDVGSFDLVETQVTAMEFVKSPPGVRDPDSVWMCTDSRKIIFYDARNPGNDEQLGFCNIPGVATQILSHMEGVFVALSNGNVIIYRRSIDGGNWILKDPLVVQLSTAGESVTSILPINANVYAACGKKVWVLNCFTGEIIKSFDIKHRQQQQQQSQSQSPQQHMMNGGSGVGSGGNNNVNLMAHSGIGLWISLKNSSIICLYHTETFKHLQDINIATNVLRVTSSSQKESLLCNNNNSSVFVTALMACKGLLWVGTNVGISLTIPLPRLEGVPIISGGVNISYHAHFGPITFMLPLIPKAHYSQQQMQQLAQQSPARIILPQTTITTTKEKDNKDISDVSGGGGGGNRMVLTDSNPETPKKKLEKQSSMDYPLFNISAKLRAQLANSPVMLRKKSPNPKEMNADSSRISKTLPRGGGLGQHGGFFSTSMNSNSSSQGSEPGYCDVYGLYGDLIFVKEDFDPEVGQLNLMDQSYECLRRSDPELACENYIAKVSTLDRRLRLKVGRPRSLDLSNWSVESRSSSLYTSSGSEESMAIRHNSMFGRSVSRNSSSASHKTQTNPSELNNITENCTVPPPSSVTDVQQQQQTQPIVDETTTTTMSNNIIQQPDTTTTTILPPPTSTMMKKKKNNNNKNAQPIEIGGRRTVISLMGGRGYINWRHVWYNNNSTSGGDKNKSNSSSGLSNSSNSRVPNSNDAHIVIWEKKL